MRSRVSLKTYASLGGLEHKAATKKLGIILCSWNTFNGPYKLYSQATVRAMTTSGGILISLGCRVKLCQ